MYGHGEKLHKHHNACRVGNSATDEKNIITRYNIQGVWLGNVNGIANIIRKRSSLGSAGFDPAKKMAVMGFVLNCNQVTL